MRARLPCSRPSSGVGGLLDRNRAALVRMTAFYTAAFWATVTAWILGSLLRFAFARPRMTKPGAICREMNPAGLDMADGGGYMPADAGFTGEWVRSSVGRAADS
ncbi:hypothetical protein MES4922_300351 [Mesorhizobium ventifaucium]|uniref:Uncharacterized protein n=1 Tax=Mesorhizobium ventifaucium TaxID=666020 RepID=A0ABM9E3T2_9HYPH|nr:hypothetical protein MES4922_300351 [Mesorhizobium ventifaucium]